MEGCEDVVKLSDRYIHHRNLLKRGQQEIALYIAIFNVSMLLSVFLRTIIHLRATWIAFIVGMCVLGILATCYIFGLIYNKRGLFQSDSKWVTARNPDIQAIKRHVENIDRYIKNRPVD